MPQILKKRDDLRVIVSSATMDAEEFKEYFNTNKTADPAQDTATIMTIQVSIRPNTSLFSWMLVTGSLLSSGGLLP